MSIKYTKPIALICIPGLPPNYGAYDQTAHQLIMHSDKRTTFLVPCETSFKQKDYDAKNVRRLFIPRFKGGLGTILYGVAGTLSAIFYGARNLVFFGYGLAPIFPFLKLFGLNVICNVDGIEWQRAKWGKGAKQYFLFCEWLVAKINIIRVYDAKAIKEYYLEKYQADGAEIFYGSDTAAYLKTKKDFLNSSVFDSRYAIVVMRLEPENSILEIVKAFLETKHIPLKIVGPSTQFFETLCMPLIEQAENIDYLGPIYNRLELIRLRFHADVYVHGHTVGGTNPTLVEACHIGKPVIAQNNKFNREVLGANSELYFDDHQDLIHLLRNDNWQNSLPRLLPKEYEWYKIHSQYIQLFK